MIAAAESALETGGSVGPLELLQHMRLLDPSHVQSWRKGRIEALEPCIQGSPEKLGKSFAFFREWVSAHGLRPVQARYLRAASGGEETLYVTIDHNPEREEFFRTHFAPADLPKRKADRLKAKLEKAPELVVFRTVSKSVICAECKTDLGKGDFLFMDKGQPLCLSCADLDHLEYLHRGDAALTRRARKHSRLSAVVVEFRKSRGRYERLGILAGSEAIARAEAECLADAPERAQRRAHDRERRHQDDAKFVAALTEQIRGLYPRCPSNEAESIARHTAERGSGRVGRSAAGRALHPAAIELAIVAHIRHHHTHYDELLMQGTDRHEARILVRNRIHEVLRGWGAYPGE